MSTATTTATTAQAAVTSPADVVYVSEDTEGDGGYTFTVTPHAPSKR